MGKRRPTHRCYLSSLSVCKDPGDGNSQHTPGMHQGSDAGASALSNEDHLCRRTQRGRGRGVNKPRRGRALSLVVTGLTWDILGLGFKFRMLFSGQTFHCDTEHIGGATSISVVCMGGSTPSLAWRNSGEPLLVPQKILHNEQKSLSTKQNCCLRFSDNW